MGKENSLQYSNINQFTKEDFAHAVLGTDQHIVGTAGHAIIPDAVGGIFQGFFISLDDFSVDILAIVTRCIFRVKQMHLTTDLGIELLSGQDLHTKDITSAIGQKINGVFIIVVGQKIRDDHGQPVTAPHACG